MLQSKMYLNCMIDDKKDMNGSKECSFVFIIICHVSFDCVSLTRPPTVDKRSSMNAST